MMYGTHPQLNDILYGSWKPGKKERNLRTFRVKLASFVGVVGQYGVERRNITRGE